MRILLAEDERELSQALAVLLRHERYSVDVVDNGEDALPSGSIRLANKEFQMMEMLMSQPGTVIPTARFVEKILGYDCDAQLHVVWVGISNLRKKLTSLDAHVRITALRGRGYALEELMIKKLRRKFMAVAMISVTLVILIMMVELNVVNYWKMDQRAEDLIGILEQNGGSFPKLEPPDDRWETEESRQQKTRRNRVWGQRTKCHRIRGKGDLRLKLLLRLGILL